MNDTAVITLIVVSAALTVFLVLLCVALGYLISILRQVKRITARAENVADTVESAAAAFERASSPLAVLKLLGKIVEQASEFKKKGK
jgi:hypothetical protein